MQNAKCKMTIAHCRPSGRGHAALAAPQPPAPNPKPRPFPSPPSAFRLGISLTEVLIAMGIMTVGLLGVASVFPVGSWQMQKAEISDRGNAIAQSVMSDIIARGMLNPRSWYVMVPWNGISPPVNRTFGSDGKYAPGSPPVSNVLGKFARPFGDTLSEALAQPTVATDATLISRQFGSAFVIDPIGMSVMTYPNGQNVPTNAHGPACTFPAAAYYNGLQYYGYSPSWPTSPWAAWTGGSKGAFATLGFEWPIRRVTFREPSTGWQMEKTMADHYFQCGDDLVSELPARADRPVQQKWDLDSASSPLARQWTGDYSWIVTVAPTNSAALRGMAGNPEGFAYDVSVVVFYKRALPEDATTAYANYGSKLSDYYNAMSQHERIVQASVRTSGPSGGELLLSDMFDDGQRSPFDGLKSGQWVMLCAPHPASSMSEPRFFLNWYQVVSIEGKEERLNNQGTTTPAPAAADPARRLITVRGPEWPWTPNGVGADNLCVGIFKGAVAVHSKTLHLESSIGSVTQSFGSAGNSQTVPPRFKP